MPELKHLEIRRMKKEDAGEAARIEAELFTSPWSQKSFEEAADSKDTLYVSAVADGQVAGIVDCGNLLKMGKSPMLRWINPSKILESVENFWNFS